VKACWLGEKGVGSSGMYVCDRYCLEWNLMLVGSDGMYV
jgi:hypothetical protein